VNARDDGFGLDETRYGFRWGPVDIERTASDPKWGVVLYLRTPRQCIEVRVTPTGLFRIGKPETVRRYTDVGAP
jgi:hypothetical protein